MTNFDHIPKEFRVFSKQPDLRIKYSRQTFHKLLFLIFLLPFFALFIGHVWTFLHGLYEILHLRFQQGIHMFSYGTGNPWSIFQFFFALFGLGFASCYGLWVLLGVVEVHAAHDSLTISHKLLGMSQTTSVLAENIQYFKQSLRNSGDESSWDLEIITNQQAFKQDVSLPAWFPAKWITEDMKIRMNYRVIHIGSYANCHLSEWLGSVLADFYKVKFQR
jgi:hypothetical protein